MVETPEIISYDMDMAVRISRSLVTRILADAAAYPDREICGLLMGAEDAVTAILPARNVAANPALRFEIDPAVLIAAHRRARQGGAAVLGHYHSHPSGLCAPSATDAADAGPDGMLWMIVAGGAARMWRAGNAGLHGRFVAAPFVLVAG